MTNKKTLLGEGTVRQFMKLANIQPPLAADFVEKLYEGDKVEEDKVEEDKVEEDKVEENIADDAGSGDGGTTVDPDDDDDTGTTNESATVNEEELELGAEEEVELGAEGPPEEPDLGAPEEEGDVDVTALVQAIADAVEEHTGVSVEVAGSEGEEEGEMDFGAEETEVDLEGPGGEEVEASTEEAEVDLEEVISTIAENVTKRLAAMTQKKKYK